MKKLTCLLLVLLLLGVSMTAFAAMEPVVDMADILTDGEETQLTNALVPYGNGAVCILTVDSLNEEDVEAYAESYAEKNGIGVLLVIAMQERRWCITSSGDYKGVIDVAVIDRIGAECVPYLRADDYYGAFSVFAEECGDYLDGYDPAVYRRAGGFKRFLICMVIGLAVGAVAAGIMAGKNKSVRPRSSAADYVRSGSMNVTVSRDIYLYHHVTRTPKPQNNSSSGRGGGSRSTRSGGF